MPCFGGRNGPGASPKRCGSRPPQPWPSWIIVSPPRAQSAGQAVVQVIGSAPPNEFKQAAGRLYLRRNRAGPSKSPASSHSPRTRERRCCGAEIHRVVNGARDHTLLTAVGLKMTDRLMRKSRLGLCQIKAADRFAFGVEVRKGSSAALVTIHGEMLWRRPLPEKGQAVDPPRLDVACGPAFQQDEPKIDLGRLGHAGGVAQFGKRSTMAPSSKLYIKRSLGPKYGRSASAV